MVYTEFSVTDRRKVNNENKTGERVRRGPAGRVGVLHRETGVHQEDGIPFTAFEVDDVGAEYRRLADLGVTITREPVEAPGVKFAVLDGTCGNLIQIYQSME